jgi:hypothetical protein
MSVRVPQQKKAEPQIAGFVGVGLDNADGHQRLSKSEHFLLVGGSEETHERMQDTAIHFDEELLKKGKRLQDTSVQEAKDMLLRAMKA